MDINEWIWYGNAGHWCGGHDCMFHLLTEVGDNLISTVGEYKHDQKIFDGHCYESMVFKITGRCKCKYDCGTPEYKNLELERALYDSPKDAREGHLKLCQKWSKK